MTKGERAFALMQQGLSYEAIAARMGISSNCVAAHICSERKKAGHVTKARVEKTCPYSADCFSCQLPDCKITHKDALVTNRLETDWGGITDGE